MIEKNERPLQAAPLLRDLQSVLSVSYLAAVGVGMLFQYKKFAVFGINIFEYADVLDFLIAPFSDRIIIAFTLFSVVVAYLLFKFDLFWEKKFPRSYARLSFGMHQRSWYGLFRMLSSVFIFAMYMYYSADVYSTLKMRQMKGSKETTITLVDNDKVNGVLIGKTKEVLFMLSNGKVSAIPISSLKTFEIH